MLKYLLRTPEHSPAQALIHHTKCYYDVNIYQLDSNLSSTKYYHIFTIGPVYYGMPRKGLEKRFSLATEQCYFSFDIGPVNSLFALRPIPCLPLPAQIIRINVCCWENCPPTPPKPNITTYFSLWAKCKVWRGVGGHFLITESVHSSRAYWSKRV